MGDGNSNDLKSLTDKLDRLLLAVTNNSDEIKQVKTQYATLNVAVNSLQSQKMEIGASSHNKGDDDGIPQSDIGGTIPLAAQRVHKLAFLSYNRQEDPLPWLNRCDQFFRVQQTPEEGKVWLATFYMTGAA